MNRYYFPLLFILFGISCQFNPGPAPEFCLRDSDCAGDRVCVNQACGVADFPEDASGDVESDMNSPLPDFGPNCIDNDGDGFFLNCGTIVDCNDSDRTIFPGATESCADNLDNDCDGATNEGCDCTTGTSKKCGSDEGSCTAGDQQCVNGKWETCEGGISPSSEICEGTDNDCNGKIDDAPEEVGNACQSNKPGVCKPGKKVCVMGSLVCNSIQQGSNETCNGKDDDCDGEIDESFSGKDDECKTSLKGVCAQGKQACQNSAIVCAPLISVTQEVCDGVDNDCDGYIDEDEDNLVLMQACVGSNGNNAWQLCEGGNYGACTHYDVEKCNGADTDGDGRADNRSACYAVCQTGGFAVGTQRCSAAGLPDCQLPSEICGDGIDNDCDGTIDQNCGTLLNDMSFIPAGPFWMGANPSDPNAENDEKPLHLADIKPLYFDKYEVTRLEYGLCMQNGSCSPPSPPSPPFLLGCPNQTQNINFPVVCVDYQQASDFCTYKEKRLPTEAEWEKAARGPYARAVIFPWGNVYNSSFAITGCMVQPDQCLVSVNSYPNGVSYYGLYNMTGNAGEMVSDFYDANFYKNKTGIVIDPENNMSTGLGAQRVFRGGHFRLASQFGRVSNRLRKPFPSKQIGFRCVRDF